MNARTHRSLTVVALMLSVFMGALEATVVSTAMPTVVGDLGGIEVYSWVFTAYMLASTVTVPLYGKIADLYGRKPLMLIGMAVFMIGSVLSGLSSDIHQLIAFRALQGIGAGAVMPVAMTIIGDLYPAAERGKIQGLFSAVWGLAGIAGPTVGSAVIAWLSWRWVFYINVPFGLASCAVMLFSLHEDVEKHDHRLDFLGAGLLAAAMVALLAGAHGASNRWLLAVAALLGVGYYAWDRRAAEPILPLSLLRIPVIGLGSVAGSLLGAVMMSATTYVPLFVQGVLHGTAGDAAASIAPMVIGWPIGSTVGGRILARVGVRPLVRAGVLSAFGGALALALLLRPGSSLNVARVAIFFVGLGLGLANSALLIAVQGAVGWSQRGVATASTMFFRTAGGALSVGLLGAVIAGTLAHDASVPAGAADQLLGSNHGAGLDPAVLAAIAQDLERGVRTVFWAIAGVAGVAVLFGLTFPKVVLEDVRSIGESKGPAAEPVRTGT